MDRLDKLEQVVKNLNETVKELQAEVKALGGTKEATGAQSLQEIIQHIEQNGSVWACFDCRDELKCEPFVYLYKNKKTGEMIHGPLEDIPTQYRSFVLWGQ